MYVISIGGIRVKGLGTMARFYYYTFKTHRQAKQHPGCIAAKLTRKNGVFFAYSIWKDRDSMRNYARNGTHSYVMANSARIVSSFDNLSFESDSILPVNTAIEMWFADRN